MGYLAHRSNRVYVFEDYTWSHLPFPYTLYDFALRSTRIPLNAFVVGPLPGGPLPSPECMVAPSGYTPQRAPGARPAACRGGQWGRTQRTTCA